MKKTDIAAYSWVLRGKQRIAVLRVMDKPKTPKQISEKTHIKFSNVSDVLKRMAEEGLASCLNPSAKRGRLYALTKKGSRLQMELED